jgi:hypothetical protein
MSLGTKVVQEKAQSNLRNIGSAQQFYLYTLPLDDTPRTANPSAVADKYQILTLNASNLDEFIETYGGDTESEDVRKDQLYQYVFEKMSSLDGPQYVQALLTTLGAPDETLNDLLDTGDEDSAIEYVQSQFLSGGNIEALLPNTADSYISQNPRLYPSNDWVNARIWHQIWKNNVYGAFGGIEFAADILNRRHPRCPWLPLLEVESGCIFNAQEFFHRAAPQLYKTVSLNPTNVTPGRNVYGQQNGIVYRVMRGASRRRKANKQRKGKKLTRRCLRAAARC